MPNSNQKLKNTKQQSVDCVKNRSNSNCSATSSISTNSSKLTNNHLEPSQIEALNLSDSALNTNTNSSVVASPNPNANDLLLSTDLANILYSFNSIIGHSLFPVNLMRSASSAGETITRSSQDIQVSIPKRAETFNGASSSKESQMSTLNNLNSDLLKNRVYKNAISSGCIHSLLSNNIQSNASEAGTTNSQTNSDLSADSGYQSRLCVDQNHDIDGENCSCAFFENNKILNRKASNASSPDTNSTSSSSSSSNTTTQISREQFESILKVILGDYMRIKKENGDLKKEIDNKNKSIDLLKKAMDEYKVGS